MPMPKHLQLRDAYCSAPPLRTSSLRPPPLYRDEEVRRPCAPLRPVKQEVRESEVDSVEFIVDERDKEVEDVKLAARPFKVEASLRVGLAAISLRPPPSSASTSSEEAAAAAPGPSHRTQALCRIPFSVLGPADQPGGRGRPKGSKSRPRIAFGLSTPPERAAKLEAEEKIAKMTPTKQV